uniref:hypothetical protein n=1 Tax=Cephaleuros parasiticus TaxID=173370 RepID=UPI001EE1244D|nr:hypothetical protein MFQ79_pgp097 [Cephaleuros parasiticus]UIB38965.1 hypothetical protein [Cephaleuros parasiticus]
MLPLSPFLEFADRAKPFVNDRGPRTASVFFNRNRLAFPFSLDGVFQKNNAIYRKSGNFYKITYSIYSKLSAFSMEKSIISHKKICKFFPKEKTINKKTVIKTIKRQDLIFKTYPANKMAGY